MKHGENVFDYFTRRLRRVILDPKDLYPLLVKLQKQGLEIFKKCSRLPEKKYWDFIYIKLLKYITGT